MQKVNLFGIDITLGYYDEIVRAAADAVRANKKIYICVANTHNIMEAQYDSLLRTSFQHAAFSVMDGMPLLWLSKLIGKKEGERIRGPSLFTKVCSLARDNKFKVFLYGTTDDVLRKLRAHLEQKFPGIIIAGVYAPPFRALGEDEKRSVIAMIDESAADIVFVGLGAPKQEKFMYEYRALLASPVMIGVGAAFNFEAGVLREAPRWMQKSGLEWLYRLSREPRRLLTRYVKYNTLFIVKAVLFLLRRKKS